MTTLPEVWLGDVARAVARLQPADAATADTIARVLGFETDAEPAEPETVVPQLDGVAPDAAGDDVGAPPSETKPVASTAGALDELQLLPSRPPIESSDVPDFRSRDALDAVESKHLYVRREHEPLFERRRERALLQAAIAVEVPGEELDEAAALEVVATARALVELPLLPRRSLGRGVQVLVDEGPGMDPFRRDIRALIATVRVLVGRSMVAVHRFEGSPLDGDYQLPSPGMPVLAVSDLGASPVASGYWAQSWVDLAALLRAQESELLALNPYGEVAVPGAALTVVRWDRATTVSGVLASRGRMR